jgi:amidase
MRLGGLSRLAAMNRVHAFGDDVLGELDAVGLVDLIRSRRAPIRDVVEAAIGRAQRVGPELNAIAYEAFDRARAEASDPRGGYFAGIPTFIKDNVDVGGMPTQQGVDAFQGTPRRIDGDFARMFLATGVIPLGKTQLSEFGFSPSAEHERLGPVRSPWNPDYTAGASSAGSAALVAAGVVPLAHANDGGGSIRIPASVNGLVGLKPTRGRLAQDRTLRRMPVQIVADGVVTRSVRDTAAFYREAEKVYRNLRLPPVGDITRAGRARLRVAVVTEGVGAKASPEVADLTLKTASLLEELGHRVEHIDPPVPSYFRDDFLLYWSMLSLFTVQTGRRTFGETWDPELLDNLTHGLVRHSRRNLHKLPLAIARLRRSGRLSARLYEQYDVVLTPTLATTTPRVGHLAATNDYDTTLERMLEWVAFTPLQNATGDPAISLPLTTTADGMPHGMMFAAGLGREALLLELAYELEAARPFPRLPALDE